MLMCLKPAGQVANSVDYDDDGWAFNAPLNMI